MNFLNKLLSGFLILLSVSVGTLGIITNQQAVLAQASGINSAIGTESIITDINQIESDNSVKFGKRLNNQFQRENIKSEPCGNTITNGILDSKLGSSVIKSVKTSCGSDNKNAKQSWLKLVWDNGLVGWVQNPIEKIVTVDNSAQTQNLFWTNLLKVGSVSVSANYVQTCKNYQYQIRDLKTLNQYPNLDLNDNGIGCEHLPINPNENLFDGKEATIIQTIKEMDKNGDNKITCADFDTQVVDLEILALFPGLDADKDGIGCEANSEGDGNLYGDETELNIPNIELSQEVLQNSIDYSALTLSLQQTLKNYIDFLTNANATCANFDLGCSAVNSLAGLGNQGMWIFKFITGLLQGSGQSIVDLLGQVWNLVSNPGDTISKIIESLKQIIKDPKLLLQIFQGELDEILKLDTLERANRIGRVIGAIIPDVIAGVVTAGVGVIGIKALQGLQVSQKVASTVIKIGKLVGKTIKIVSDIPAFTLSKVGTGVGILGSQMSKFVKTLDDTAFGKLLSTVKNTGDKAILTTARQIFKNSKLLDSKLIRFSQSTINKTFSR